MGLLLALLLAQDLDAELRRANPGLEKADLRPGRVSLSGAVADLSPLKGRPLTSLLVRGSTTLTDLSPLRGMELTTLDLQGSRALRDLSPLEGMPLSSVTFYACRTLSDISPLKGAKLTSINFEGTSIRDLSPLRGQPISWARICCPVLDLSPLKGMPLKHVDVGGGTGNDRNLKDLSPLREMSEMTDLRFDQTSVPDLSDVKGMRKLKFLAFFDTPVRDLSPLEGLELEQVFFTPRNVPPEQLRILRDMKSLKHVDVSWRTWPKPMTAKDFWTRYDAGEFR